MATDFTKPVYWGVTYKRDEKLEVTHFSIPINQDYNGGAIYRKKETFLDLSRRIEHMSTLWELEDSIVSVFVTNTPPSHI